jgi:hypothetical protein
MSRNTEVRTVQIIMDGSQPAKTLNQLNQDINKVTKALRGTADQQTRVLQGHKVRELRGEYTKLNETLLGTNRRMNFLKDQIATTVIGVLGGNLLTSLTGSIGGYLSGTLDYVTKTSDQLADLRRVAGITAEEIDGIAGGLSKITTRTSNSDLREVAIVAGKLGIAKKDIIDFTQAVDMLVVSLGDELGSADNITEQLGKILNVYNLQTR